MPLRRTIRVGLLCIVVLSAPGAAQQTSRGFTYDLAQRMQTSTGGIAGPEMIGLRAKVLVDAAGSSRIDVLESAKGPTWQAGDYALSTASNSLLIVSPARKEYLDLGGDMGAAEMSEMMKSTGMVMKTTEVGFTFDSLPGTELINGLVTKHFHMIRESTATMSTVVNEMSMTMKSETDYFVVRDRVPKSNPVVAQNPSMMAGLGSLVSPELVAKMAPAMKAMNGLVVRSVTHSMVSGIGGAESESTLSTDITNLMDATIPSIPSAPPAGYTKASLVARMKAMMGG